MDADELVWCGESVLQQLENIIKRTPEAVLTHGPGGEEFESAEHENIGDKVKLRFPTQEQGVLGAKRFLTLPNGLQLSFGQIIALAGDFYGIPENPIIDPRENKNESPTSRRERFIAAYNTLARAKYDDIKKELDQILQIMTKERSQIQAAVESQEQKVAIYDNDGFIRTVPKDVYDKLGNSLVEKWDTITGGKWFFGIPVIFGRIMKLAKNNTDHFMPFAKDAYLAGHEFALEKAREASKGGDQDTVIKLLEEAYSVDAFACHFLTDSFSSGHLRTPRYELAKQITISLAGDLLSKYMHDEDSTFGLRVTNRRGDKWIAYGDGMLLNQESEGNRRIAVDAVQASVNQIYDAFLYPEKAVDLSKVTDYIPFVDASEKNNSPMFQVKEGQLLRRADLSNLSDPDTKIYWTAPLTIKELQSYTPSGSAIEEYDDFTDCRSCSQSLLPKILTMSSDTKP